MLQARMKSGRLITPASLSRSKLTQLKLSKQKFYCPACSEKVILRSGERVIAHFAHTAKASCPSATGGEGPYHEQGKLLLYQWLVSQHIKVELEAFLPEINQRPDLLIHLNGRRIAIEYQCAKIPKEQIVKRTEGYKQVGIQVIWVLGAKLLKRSTRHTIKIDSFTASFIHQFSSTYPQSLFYFCPQTFKFIKFQDVSFLGKNRAAGKTTVHPLKSITLKDIFVSEYISNESLISIWKREKRWFRLKPRGRLYGTELQWHQWLYLKQLHLEQLPAIIYLPVQGEHLMKTPGWIWQSRLVFDVIYPLQIGKEFQLRSCLRVLSKHIYTPDDFPLIQTNDNPLMEYLHLLARNGTLEQTSENTFKKIKQIHLHQQVESAVEEDEHLIEQLFTKNQTKYEHETPLVRYTK